jgi:hypothetical protein
MNPKHTAALLLFALGAFLLIVGGILVGVGLPGGLQAADTSASKLGWTFAFNGIVVFAAGIAALLLGIHLYRHSDHQLPKDRSGVRRFPILSPMMGVLLLLAIGMQVLLVIQYGFDWGNSREVGALVLLVTLTFSFLAAALGAVRKRGNPGPTSVAPLTPGSSREAETPAGEVRGG